MPSKSLSFILLAILAVIWGSSFILMKRGLDAYTPAEVGAIRIFISFLCMTPFLIRSLRSVPHSKWKFLALSGFLGNGIPALLFPLAETQLSSAVAGMLNSLTPLFVFILGMSMFGMKYSQNRMFGLIIGMTGTAFIIAGHGSSTAQTNVLYAMIIVLATICYAFSVNIIKTKLAEITSIAITSMALMFAGIPMGIYLTTTDVVHRTMNLPGAGFSLLCIIILGALGTAFSTVIFNKVVKLSGALFASSVTYLIPIVAMMWGFADNESISVVHFAGLAGVLSGVYLINKK